MNQSPTATLIEYMQYDARYRRFPVDTDTGPTWVSTPDWLRFSDSRAEVFDGYSWRSIAQHSLAQYAQAENVVLR